VKDPDAGRECIEENKILRKNAPFAIEDTGGYFVALDDADLAFLPKFVEGCRKIGIPVEEISGEQARRDEPALTPEVKKAVTVPDGSIDGYALAAANAADARRHGARTFMFTPVVEILRKNGSVVGVKAVDQKTGEHVEVHAKFVVNAAGAWSGRVAALAGVPLDMAPDHGTMVVIEGRPVKRAINRCRPPADGDIIVPIGTTVVLGTTAVPTPDPDNFTIGESEVQCVISECVKMVPAIGNMGVRRTYAGVRPLYKPPEQAGETRSLSRSHYVIDHEKRDGVPNFLTITGGKVTTYRLMAQHTADAVCAHLNVDKPCRTHLEPLTPP
jgi:glycerol-3-phosphate dehydrogenase